MHRRQLHFGLAPQRRSRAGQCGRRGGGDDGRRGRGCSRCSVTAAATAAAATAAALRAICRRLLVRVQPSPLVHLGSVQGLVIGLAQESHIIHCTFVTFEYGRLCVAQIAWNGGHECVWVDVGAAVNEWARRRVEGAGSAHDSTARNCTALYCTCKSSV